VHGGPTGAHVNGFKVGVHNGAQLWAGQGWAVLYPNPRGSSNYGEKFMRGNIPDWGGGDYRDIMAGTDEVIKRGIADPDKLAVMGWSYGGYMTCWIVSQTSRFKAARMGAGLSNISSMYGTTDIPGYIGTFFENYPTPKNLTLYQARSGLTFVDRVTTPLLIMHGMNDERVPIGQPMEFYRALKDRGKTVELVWYPREGHGFTEYYHQRDQIRRELEWMTKYVLGAARTTTSQQ
jgi:dipeptidyl aminopeptidase/acylaminoacyl peptidase